MIRIDIKQTDNIIDVLNQIKRVGDLNIELVIPEGSIIFENALNLKLIQYEADKMDKSIDFITNDEIGNNLIASLTGEGSEAFVPEEFESKEETVERKGGNILKRMRINFPSFRLPHFALTKKPVFIPVAVVFLAICSFIYYGATSPKAIAKINISSTPLTRSVTVRVTSGSATDVQNKTLRGTILSTNVEEMVQKDTTGTKTVGEKAEGEIKIYNKTANDIKLEKGDKVVYSGKNTDLKYLLTSDVDVPASAPSDPLDPASALIPGEAVVKIIAADIGSSYNIDDGKSLEFSDYKKSELEGKTKDKISGGKSEEVKVVTQEDLTSLSETAKNEGVQKAESGIKSKLGSGQKLVTGSTETEIVSQSFSSKVGDEATKVSLNQSISSKALVYTDSELNSFINKYVEDVVPANFVLSDQDKEIKVDVLGKSSNSVLTSSEADIQVTLKAFVVPDLKEEEIKNSLKGKGYKEAQKIIGELKNVESYEFSISPSIPFFKKTPNNINRIEVDIIRK